MKKAVILLVFVCGVCVMALTYGLYVLFTNQFWSKTINLNKM